MDGIPPRVLLLGFEQNFLGLRVTPVSHINVGFGDRINFIGVDAARTGLTKISLCRCMRGVNALTAGTAEDRIGGQAAALERQTAAQIKRRFAIGVGATTPDKQIGRKEQRKRATGERQRVT